MLLCTKTFFPTIDEHKSHFLDAPKYKIEKSFRFEWVTISLRGRTGEAARGNATVKFPCSSRRAN